MNHYVFIYQLNHLYRSIDKLDATAKELKEDYSNVEVKVRIILYIYVRLYTRLRYGTVETYTWWWLIWCLVYYDICFTWNKDIDDVDVDDLLLLLLLLSVIKVLAIDYGNFDNAARDKVKKMIADLGE